MGRFITTADTMKNIFALVFIGFILLNQGFSQKIAPEILSRKWNAYWIASESDFQRNYGVYHFRKVFLLETKPSSFVIHISADNRYKLFVNGIQVSLGPARGDLFHWNFETVDIAPYLHAGRNLIAAVVWNLGLEKGQAQISYQTAFIVQGNTENEKNINTDTSWKCIQNHAYSPIKPDLIYAYYAAGPGEKIDFSHYPNGWETLDFDDKPWSNAKTLFQGLPKSVFEYTLGWMLVPRNIPQMELRPQRFLSLRSVAGISLTDDFLKSRRSFEIPGRTKVTLIIDQQFLTNAYPVLQFSKGKGAHILLSYAESLYVDEGDGKNWKEQNKKYNRNDIKGKRFVGVRDELVADGKKDQTFTSLSWRTFRYLQIVIETADEAFTVDDLYSIYTGYPFEMKAHFNAGDSVLDKILEVGWRTARSCAMETYMDCPYYEQLQYVGDMRIQAMVSLFNSGDDRLMRNAISQLDYSRMSEGITLSRYPSADAQEIPTFSLWWIDMLRDYQLYRNDPAFVKSFLPGVRQVLSFFSKYQQKDGSLKNAPYWEFTDFADGWDDGVPPVGEDGSSAPLDLQLLLAYQTAAKLEKDLGMKEFATFYQFQALKLLRTIKSKYWDNRSELFSDTKERIKFSQQTNSLAILTGVISGVEAKDLAKKMLSDRKLTQATIYFKYYLNQAITKAGLGDMYLDQLQIWKDNLAYGMTTWAELSDINTARSDCHAWGASPSIELFRIVLGIDSDSAGFDKIRITPHLGRLKNASGSIPHPRGEIKVNYQIDKDGKFNSVISIPQGTSGTLFWKGKKFILKGGQNNYSIQ
jgi:alpha-L-rhamnosidase